MRSLTFRRAVWLIPPAFALHVMEEWPRFTAWANRYASDRFTQHDYVVIHLSGIAGSVLSAWLLARFPNRVMTFLRAGHRRRLPLVGGGSQRVQGLVRMRRERGLVPALAAT